jgi:hypothetical protein
MSPDVAKVFDAYPETMRQKLMALRTLILEVAANTDGVGPLEETLKWGEPSYLTSASKSGTTIRIHSTGADRYGLYVNCRTNLIDTYRSLYPDAFVYEGDRAVVMPLDAPLPVEPLDHCIALALTYHRRKAKSRRG